MKHFVKALERNDQCFKFISQNFPGLSSGKLKAGILDGLKAFEYWEINGWSKSLGIKICVGHCY